MKLISYEIPLHYSCVCGLFHVLKFGTRYISQIRNHKHDESNDTSAPKHYLVCLHSFRKRSVIVLMQQWCKLKEKTQRCLMCLGCKNYWFQITTNAVPLSCTTWHVWTPVNKGINYHFNWLAGFLPSTVVIESDISKKNKSNKWAVAETPRRFIIYGTCLGDHPS